jgi:hypothetical protein
MADRGGFEPPIRYERIHAFQACAFNHSATCPIRLMSTTHKRKHESLTGYGFATQTS